jgi:hypothetical protein
LLAAASNDPMEETEEKGLEDDLIDLNDLYDI